MLQYFRYGVSTLNGIVFCVTNPERAAGGGGVAEGSWETVSVDRCDEGPEVLTFYFSHTKGVGDPTSGAMRWMGSSSSNRNDLERKKQQRNKAQLKGGMMYCLIIT